MFPSTRFSKIDCMFYPNCEKGDLCPFAHNRIINHPKIKIKSFPTATTKNEKHNKNYRTNSSTPTPIPSSPMNKKIQNYSDKSERHLKKTFNKLNLQKRENNGRNSTTTTATTKSLTSTKSTSSTLVSTSTTNSYYNNKNTTHSMTNTTLINKRDKKEQDKKDENYKRFENNQVNSCFSPTSSICSSYISPVSRISNKNTMVEKRKENITPGSIPKILPTAISKIPRDVRQRMAITFFKEFQRIYEPIQKINPDLARQHSLDQEKALYDKSSKKTYKISASHILTHLKARKLATSIQDVGIDGIWKPFSIQKVVNQGIDQTELKILESYLIKKDQFKKLNYPTKELLKEYYKKKNEERNSINSTKNNNKNRNSNGSNDSKSSGNSSNSSRLLFNDNPYLNISKLVETKICSRCQCSYIPKKNEDVPLLTESEKEACTFHYGKLRKESNSHSSKRIYSCCQGNIGSKGCTKGPHVWKCESFDGLQEAIPFTRLPKADPTNKNILKVAALDCEMSYTTGGLELTRITVVNWKGDVVMDELCKPHNCIIDLNTRYSGIKELDSVTLDLDGVKEKMSKIMNRNTIIIGQGLENDFNALRLIHDRVIDTVLLYPHPMGLPLRYGLRYLANKYLQRFIQDGVDGHDSYEDSKTCIDLVKMKMKKGKDFGIV